MNNIKLEEMFPKIKGTNYTIINNTETNVYNCISFSVGDITKWWWPKGEDAYWPTIENDTKMETFIKMYQSINYINCELDDSIEDGYEKIAIYGFSLNEIKHAAKQSNDLWKSKIGDYEIVIHTLNSLTGNYYVNVLLIMKRKI